MEYRTSTITLKHGFVDADKKAHKTIILVEPLLDHEIKRDNAVNKMRMSDDENTRLEAESEAVQATLLIIQCCVEFGGIQNPGLEHFRALRSIDTNAIVVQFKKLKNEEPTEGE